MIAPENLRRTCVSTALTTRTASEGSLPPIAADLAAVRLSTCTTSKQEQQPHYNDEEQATMIITTANTNRNTNSKEQAGEVYVENRK